MDQEAAALLTHLKDGVAPMTTLAMIIVVIVALQHVAFFVLESFLWQKAAGRAVFKLSREHAAITAPLAKNQGVYNAFLAAGLFWGLKIAFEGRTGKLLSEPHMGHVEYGRAIVLFFLGCVVVAGVVGAATVNRRIFWVQAVPALMAACLILAW